MVQLSKILITIAFVSVIVVGFSLFLSEGLNKYSPSGYNNSTLENIKSINQEINNITNQTQEKISKLQTNTNIINLLDFAVTQTFDAAKITAKSVDSMAKITFESQKATSPFLGELNNVLYAWIGAAVLIIVVIALLMQFIIKSDRL